MISHLRGRTPEIGADIWDNSTLPDLRCSMAGGGRSGCSSAPACDNVGQCTQKEMTCTAYKWTECRGCFRGAPGCPSGYSCQYVTPDRSDFVHQGGGAFCNLACCYRIGKKTRRRSCPKTGCAPPPPPPAPPPPPPAPAGGAGGQLGGSCNDNSCNEINDNSQTTSTTTIIESSSDSNGMSIGMTIVIVVAVVVCILLAGILCLKYRQTQPAAVNGQVPTVNVTTTGQNVFGGNSMPGFPGGHFPQAHFPQGNYFPQPAANKFGNMPQNRCLRCGWQRPANDPGKKFCGQCGAPL